MANIQLTGAYSVYKFSNIKSIEEILRKDVKEETKKNSEYLRNEINLVGLPIIYVSITIFGYLLLLERKVISFFNLRGFESRPPPARMIVTCLGLSNTQNRSGISIGKASKPKYCITAPLSMYHPNSLLRTTRISKLESLKTLRVESLLRIVSQSSPRDFPIIL